MTDKRLPFLCAVVLFVATASSAATISDAGTWWEFDENNFETNAVDTDTGGLLQFKSLVSSAWSGDYGGVIDWDHGVTATNSTSQSPANYIYASIPIKVTFGQSAGRTMDITCSADGRLCTRNYYGIPISSDNDPAEPYFYKHRNYIFTGHDNPDPSVWTLSFSRGDVTQVALAMLSVGTAMDVDITADFSGGGNQTRTDNIDSGDDDTFYYFVAPQGQYITALTIDNTTSLARIAMDDLGFIVFHLIPGDANEDGVVNLSDFSILKANFGSPGGWNQGDFNGDGNVNLADFTLLKANFGETNWPSVPAPTGGGSIVPEPASAMLLVPAALAALRRRRPRR